MSEKFFELSTYHVPVSVFDADGEPFDLTGADVQFQMNANRKSGDELFHFTNEDDAVLMDEGENHEFEVRIDATEMDVPNTVFEEVRVTVSDKSAVVMQRTVDFTDVVTQP